MGKNTNLINKKQGSFFIAELIIDLEVEIDLPVLDHCGTCTACIDACPTQAIVAPYEVDGSKCISYFTIELKDSIPNRLRIKWTTGCLVVMFVKMYAHGIGFPAHITKCDLNLTQIY